MHAVHLSTPDFNMHMLRRSDYMFTYTFTYTSDHLITPTQHSRWRQTKKARCKKRVNPCDDVITSTSAVIDVTLTVSSYIHTPHMQACMHT